VTHQTSFSQAEFADKKKITRREKFLARMEEIIPWQSLMAVIEPFYPKGQRGRPPIELERMLRMYFLQQWYGLADEAVEDAIYDSQSMRGFTRIDLGADGVPDATTLLKFRRLLETNDLCKALFTAANASDISKTAEFLHGRETQVHADAGYIGVEKREEIKTMERAIDWQIAGKRGQLKKMEESPAKELLKAAEKAKASVRAFVEHPFHIVKNLFKYRKVRYRGLAKNGHQLHVLFGLANLVIAGRKATA
jgi:IS5 family transposase